MRTRIIDLDGSLTRQHGLLRRHRPETIPLRPWGPRVRLGCSFRTFREFEGALAGALGGGSGTGSALSFYGSGDFHHVSLALVRRQSAPFNLLVLDNHPDWMRGVPLLHCGTWLYHAARLPQVRRVFHCGGDVDFDNYYRPMAPWRLLRGGKIVVLPAVRRFHGGPWRRVPQQPLRPDPAGRLTRERLRELLGPWRADLARHPLYISLDKDVLVAADAVVNWDSGHLTLDEAGAVLGEFIDAAGRVTGMDVTGDWSPVAVEGLLRWFLHRTEHPPQAVDPEEATRRNEQTNLALLERLEAAPFGGARPGQPRVAG
jgi:hypothetical protein